jgi:2,4-dienoyl-CoA reductase-like NADH-dependent reductase (Old Yellow Enzyme family)
MGTACSRMGAVTVPVIDSLTPPPYIVIQAPSRPHIHEATSGEKTSLFSEIRLGSCLLPHKIMMTAKSCMATLSAREVEKYYERSALQIEETGASLIVTEPLSEKKLARNAKLWSSVTHVVHERKGYVFARLMQEPSGQEDSSSHLTNFFNAGAKALEFGFDGIELDASDGLLKWYLDSARNDSTESGIDFSSRVQFVLKAIEATISGFTYQDCVALRIAPASTHDEEDTAQFYQYLLSEVTLRYPKIAYICLEYSPKFDIKALRCSYRGEGQVLVVSFQNEIKKAAELVKRNWIDAVMIGELFEENIDLPHRIRNRKQILGINP